MITIQEIPIEKENEFWKDLGFVEYGVDEWGIKLLVRKEENF